MSDPTDIKALDEYLKGDSDVSRRYRELGRDEVPPELDRRVLAAARDAVANEGRQRSRSWLRWSAPVALAASVVLVVTVVLERGPEDELTAVPTQAPAEPQASGLVRDKAANEAEETKLTGELRKQRAGAAQDTPVYIQTVPEPARQAGARDVPPLPAPAAVTAAKAEARPVSPPPEITVEAQALRNQGQLQASPITTVTQEQVIPPPAADQFVESPPAERREAETDSARDLQEVSVTGARTRRATGRTAGPRGTISTTSGLAGESRPASDDERADRSDPAAWLEEIRDLRRAGKSADADREWDLFRKAFPDFQVAADDIARRKP